MEVAFTSLSRGARLEGSDYLGDVSDDTWASSSLANLFVDGAYATVKGYVRTYVMHQHLLEHLPTPPATVLDLGGGAGHQSFPLAQAGYEVTVLDPSPAMLDKARERLGLLPSEAQRRVTLVQANGEEADEALDGRRFDGVLCHGVLGLPGGARACDRTAVPLCDCGWHRLDHDGKRTRDGGTAGHGTTMADALAAFDQRTGIGVLGVPGRADTVEEVSGLIERYGVEPMCWYGVWLFVDWLEFSGAELDPTDVAQVAATAAVELEASRRDPYRGLSRVFHLLGQKGPS